MYMSGETRALPGPGALLRGGGPHQPPGHPAPAHQGYTHVSS